MELRVSEPADIAKHSNGYEQREREKPPEDKGVYRFLGRKDCIFSSPFSNNTGSNNFAVALTPPLLFHSPTPPPFRLHIIRIIIIRHDQVYAISRRYLREMTIYCVFSWKCVFQRRRVEISLPIIVAIISSSCSLFSQISFILYYCLFPKIELSLLS